MADEIEKYNEEVNAVLEDPELDINEKLIKALEIASKYNIEQNGQIRTLKKTL